MRFPWRRRRRADMPADHRALGHTVQRAPNDEHYENWEYNIKRVCSCGKVWIV